MTTNPDEPLLPDVDPDVDPDVEPAAEPADAVDQQRSAWPNEDDVIVPDADRPVPIEDDDTD